jgi:hypothetical protein
LHVAKRSHSKKTSSLKKIKVDQLLPAEGLPMDPPLERRSLYRATRIGSTGAGKDLEGGRLGDQGLGGGGPLGDRGRRLAAALLALLVTPGESSPAAEAALGRNASTPGPAALGSAPSAAGVGSVASVAADMAAAAASQGGLGTGGLGAGVSATVTGGLMRSSGLGIIIGGAIGGVAMGKRGAGHGVVGAASSGGSSMIGVITGPRGPVGGGGAIAPATGRIIAGCQIIPGCHGKPIPLAAGGAIIPPGAIIPGRSPPCPIIMGCAAIACIIGAVAAFLSSCSNTSNNEFAKWRSARRSPAMAPSGAGS